MNLKKKFVIGAASVALVAGMGGVAAPAAVADPSGLSLPGSIMKLERLGGLDRVQTSLAVAEQQFAGKAAERLYIVSAADANMVDAATAGMLTDGPIAFVYNNSYVASAVGKFFTDAKFAGIKEVVAIGGDGVISDNTLNAVKDALKVKKSSRLAGKDRYETSVAIADYIYSESLKGNTSFAGRVWDKGSYLANAYLANGANEHVVDSMVAGTLDDGAILLVQPDGKIPEVVAEFIKKALPTQFSALGGTGAVADATVNEAWVIKALGNKWETSYSIPNLRDKIDELEKLINGVEGKTGTDMSKPETFGGLKFVVETASANNDSWQTAVSNEMQQISNWFVNNRGNTSDVAYTAIKANLDTLFGPGIVTSDQKFFKLDANKKATGVDYDAIKATQAYKDAVKEAEDQLDRVWADKHQGTVTLPIAVASQEHKTKSAAANQFAQIAEVAKYTLDNDKKWLDASEKQLASLKGEWRTEYDKIAPKTVQRFGGADRFETAQLIANWFAKHNNVAAAYVANGTRLADSLAAGQLKGGPILLVRNDTKIPEFTSNVATHLLCWNGNPISVYGVGGTGVLSDDVLSTVTELIGTKSACKVKAAKSDKLVASPGLTVHVGDAAGAITPTVTVDNITTKANTQLAGDAKVTDNKGADASTLFEAKKSDCAPGADGALACTVKTKATITAAHKDKAPYTVEFEDADGNTAKIMIGIADALKDLSVTSGSPAAANHNASAPFETTGAIELKLDEAGTDLFGSSDVDLSKLTVTKVILGAETLPTDTVSAIDGDAGQNGKIKLKFKATDKTGDYFVVLHYADATGTNDVQIKVVVA